MWRIWFFFGILKISFAAPVGTSQEDIIPASELSVLKCLLSSPLTSCDDVKRSAEKIPKRIQKIYEKLKRPLFNTSNEVVDSASLDSLPASLLYLIPKVRLSSMTGLTASNIMRKFPFDDALTMKILSLFTEKTSIKNFLNGLADREEVVFVSDDEVVEEESITELAPISPAVEKEIALSLSIWFPNGSQWEYWLYKASMVTGTPIMANLPNYFLKSLPLETTERFLFHLRNWRWDYMKFYDSSWSQHSMSVKRIWSSIVLNKAEPPNRWTPKILRKFSIFLIGATPDELRLLSTDLRISHDFNLLLELNWSALQARAVFDVGFSEMSDLNENNLNGGKDAVIYLLPRQIQQFSYNTTSFSFVKSTAGISLPTEKQLFESYLAFLMAHNRTKEVTPALWRNHVRSAGKFYHLLPASTLEMFLNESLDLESLAKTDSPSLTFRQAYYLSNRGSSIELTKPETVVKFKGILKAVPTYKLAQVPLNMISHSVKEHLLMFSCGESLPFRASVFEKVRQDLAQTSYLEKMLYSKDFRENFNLLGNRDITDKFNDINSKLLDIISRNPVLERNVRLLPQNTLSVLLSMHRQEAIRKDSAWTYENLVESPVKLYISGLTCTDIESLETTDFMPVIGYYVHQRRAMNEVFPKNMQYCSQKALTDYLKLKVSLRGLTNEPFGLLEFLEPHEIRAVGGYVLASLPIDIIHTLGSKYQIISEVGKLTIPELLTATSLENVKQLAEIYVSHSDTLDLRVMTGFGNLVWFLSEDKISKLNVDDFKLHLESLEENSHKALCLNENERKAWKQLFIRTFGKPDSWSSGTLNYLGDLLFVLDSYELERINRTSWTEAADVLAKSTSFYNTLEWPGRPKPIYLYEACLEVLKIPERISYKNSMKQLLRYYLESAQFLLDTVAPVQRILKLHEEPNLVENAQSMGSPLITTLVSNHAPELVQPSAGQLASSGDYDYDSEEEDYLEDEDDDDDDDDDLESDVKTTKDTSQIENRRYSVKKVTETLSNESDSSASASQLQTVTPSSEEPDVSQNNTTSTGNLSKESDSNDSDDVNIFRSKMTKSLEELKEELQRNASRALIIEVPLNRSEFLNYPTPAKNHMKISCDAIRMLGKPASLILDVKDFEHMEETEVEDCAEVLGALELESDVRKFLWNKLNKWKLSGNLMEVGNLVAAIDENDVPKIPLGLDEPWALENLYSLSTHITEPDMMSFITDQFLLKNMDLQSLEYVPAISLGRLVCTMTLSHQKKYLLSHPKVFTSVAKSLGNTLKCGTVVFDSCIQQLASIATSPEAFGETSKWTANDVSDLGVIVAGLKKSDWEGKKGMGLKTEAFAGLTPTAVSCIPPDLFRVLTEDQLLRIPTLSASALSPEQTSSLSPSQYEIIDRVRRQIPPDDLTASFTSGAPKAQNAFYLSVTVSIFVASRTFFYL